MRPALAIVTDVGGVGDYVQRKASGADFVKPDDAFSIVELLKHYAANRNKLCDRGAAARSYATEYFSWKRVAGAFVEVLKSGEGSVSGHFLEK